MKIINSSFKSKAPTAVAIGNFDGVHIGHQAIIKQLLEIAEENGAIATVVIFEPQPAEFFGGSDAPLRLNMWRDKVNLLRQFGVEQVLTARFNASFAALSATDFITKFLKQQLQATAIIVGDDFRFGCKRQGDVALLQQLAASHNYKLMVMPKVSISQERVSSTAIRHAVTTGKLAIAKQLLGHDYTISGKVCHGNKLGRKIGFPTANIPLEKRKMAVQGIYVVTAKLKGKNYPAVASVGVRPTVDGEHHLLEVYIFDFNQDIYGERLEVKFLKKLRDEEKYIDVPTLVAQIKIDVEQAKEFFKAGEY